MNFANNKKFGHSQLRAYFLHLDFFEKLMIRYLQLHLPCFGGNQFKNDIEKALGPNRLIKSSNSLSP